MSINIWTDSMQHAALLGKPVLFTNWLIQRDIIPDGWYCYDLRGTHKSPSTRTTLVDHAADYHAGTVLSPIPLKHEGTASRRVNGTFYLLGEEMTLEQFCEEHDLAYPQDNREFVLRPASLDEVGLFYSEEKLDEALGTVGHLRMDFGHGEKEFWHTWWPHNEDRFNTPEFKEVLQRFVDDLRQTGLLKNLGAMDAYCWQHGGSITEDRRSYGYIAETENYRFCLRCTPFPGEYQGYLYLKWYEDSRPVTKSFITGKTLGETGADLDRMFLISSAITKAFHGDGETYARHLRQGERAEPEGMIVHLNPTEQRTIIEALVEQQERQEQAMSQTEQLLRRMTGSITAYMDEVGRYPLHISDYDKTVLAIRDGEFDAFKNLYPRVSDQTDDLLIEVAGRPGVVGGNMTLILLAAVERFSPEAYLTACKRAVETGDSWRVQTLVKESEGRLSEPLPSLHGEVILYAYTNNCRNIAKDLIAQCTPEQIASVPPKLLRWVAEKLDFQTAVDLVDKGVRPGDEVAGILRTLTGQHQEWMAERLLEHGMPVEPDNYDALYACVSNQAVGAAKLLLDRGIDLEQYQLWAEHRPKGDGYTETMEELAAYWSELQNSTQPEDSPMKGMNL